MHQLKKHQYCKSKGSWFEQSWIYIPKNAYTQRTLCGIMHVFSQKLKFYEDMILILYNLTIGIKLGKIYDNT